MHSRHARNSYDPKLKRIFQFVWSFFEIFPFIRFGIAWTGRIKLKKKLGYDIKYLSIWAFMRYPCFLTQKVSKGTFLKNEPASSTVNMNDQTTTPIQNGVTKSPKAPQEPWCVAQLDDTGRGMSGNIRHPEGCLWKNNNYLTCRTFFRNKPFLFVKVESWNFVRFQEI